MQKVSDLNGRKQDFHLASVIKYIPKGHKYNYKLVDNFYLSFKVIDIGQWSEPKIWLRISTFSTLGINRDETKK